MNRPRGIFPGLWAVFLSVLMFWPFHSSAGDLLLLAGAGLRRPTDQLIQCFEERTGHRVFVDYGGSGNLMARVLVSGQGDLFLPGAFFYIEKLGKEGLIHSHRLVVAHTPVVGVHRDTTQDIRSFEDLARPEIRVALGDPKAMAFGRTAMDILGRSGLKDAILKNVVVYGATVKQLAFYVAQGDVDASIIGRADAIQFQDSIRVVPIPTAYFQSETIAVAVLKNAAHRPEAKLLQDFLSSHEAVRIFERFGFLPLTNLAVP